MKCKKIVEQKKAIARVEGFFCHYCFSKLIYFGKESVKLSDQAVFEAYDLKHDYDPVSDFKNLYKNYNTIYTPEYVLECDDILKYDPKNVAALLFLAKYNISLGTLSDAKKYVDNLLSIQHDNVDYLKLNVDLLIYLKRFKDALICLDKLQKIAGDTFFVHYRRGLSFLCNDDYVQSLESFYHAFYATEVESNQEQIAGILTWLDGKVKD
ncbi:hypothetical protein DID76_03340 [Candidatus Marinamargulisbacteria bacterium SCGC AG-414-C22]|nr:hypothetical protein DID76_03340 [Candidatus Marinamargulisbacteria bacterium SCGC AG-414-C22]